MSGKMISRNQKEFYINLRIEGDSQEQQMTVEEVDTTEEFKEEIIDNPPKPS